MSGEHSLPTTGALARRFYAYVVFASGLFQRGIFLLFLADRGFTPSQVGVLLSAFYLTSSLAEIPTGVIADRFGRRASVLVGQVLLVGCLLAQLFAHGFPTFMLIFIIQGVSAACVSGAEVALMYDSLAIRGDRARYVHIRSRYTALGSLAIAAAITIGGFLQGISWSVVYLAAAISVLISVLMLLRIPEVNGGQVEDDDDEEAASADLGWRRGLSIMLHRAGGPRVLLLVVTSGLMHATITPYFIFSQVVLQSQGATTQVVGAVIATAYLLGGVAPLAAPWLSERFGVERLTAVTLIGLAACLFATGFGVAPLTAALFLVAVTVPETTAVLLDQYFQDRLPSSLRASLTSAITFVESALIALGYLVIGGLAQRLGPTLGTCAFGVVPIVAFGCFATYLATASGAAAVVDAQLAELPVE